MSQLWHNWYLTDFSVCALPPGKTQSPKSSDLLAPSIREGGCNKRGTGGPHPRDLAVSTHLHRRHGSVVTHGGVSVRQKNSLDRSCVRRPLWHVKGAMASSLTTSLLARLYYSATETVCRTRDGQRGVLPCCPQEQQGSTPLCPSLLLPTAWQPGPGGRGSGGRRRSSPRGPAGPWCGRACRRARRGGRSRSPRRPGARSPPRPRSRPRRG